MPIEREFKYVLDKDAGLEEVLKAQAELLGLTVYDIDQGYLGKGGRVRKKAYRNRRGYPVNPNLQYEYVFTYKHDLTSCPGALEIECPLSEEDFKLAWVDSHHRIMKTRYVVESTDQFRWEIDFFRNEVGETYFALAECEVPHDQGPPEAVHPLVLEHLILAVEESDNRFQNRKLSDPVKVATLLEEIACVTPATTKPSSLPLQDSLS